jgi:hypothetical protein
MVTAITQRGLIQAGVVSVTAESNLGVTQEVKVGKSKVATRTPPPRASDEQGETSGKYARHKFRKSPETGGKTDFLYGS